MFCSRALSICAPSNIDSSPRRNDVRVVKESSTFVWIAGLFKTAFDFLTKPTNFIPKERRIQWWYSDLSQNKANALDDLENTDGRFHTATAVDTYLTSLKVDHCVVATNLLRMDEKRTLSDTYNNLVEEGKIENETRLVAIPYDNFGHHVVIMVDLENKRIEYFDPKGASCNAPESKRGLKTFNEIAANNERQNAALQDLVIRNEQIASESKRQKEFRGGVNLCAEIQELSQKLFSRTSVIQNFEQHQWDHHNCGIWGSYYITERFNGKSVDQINYNVKMSNFAKTMAAQIRAMPEEAEILQ